MIFFKSFQILMVATASVSRLRTSPVPRGLATLDCRNSSTPSHPGNWLQEVHMSTAQ